jgi:hypothetical protein
MFEIDSFPTVEEVEQLIDRMELRLEQYRIHADALEVGSRDQEHAVAMITRVEERIVQLKWWRDRKTLH